MRYARRPYAGVVVLEEITPIRWFSEGCASLLFMILSPISKIKHNNFGY
jgi:hypothetical protein